MLTSTDLTTRVVLLWIAAASVLALAAFGFDKLLARRGARRISEFQLCALAALGGWPGALVGMLAFRHKTAKPSFIAKFLVALLIFGTGCILILRHANR